MLKNERFANRSASNGVTSAYQSSSKNFQQLKIKEDGAAAAAVGTKRANRVVFKTSNTPSLDLERNLPDRCKS
jgi:hypothetical protein